MPGGLVRPSTLLPATRFLVARWGLDGGDGGATVGDGCSASSRPPRPLPLLRTDTLWESAENGAEAAEWVQRRRRQNLMQIARHARGVEVGEGHEG